MNELIYLLEFNEECENGSICTFIIPDGITIDQAKKIEELCKGESDKQRDEDFPDYLDIFEIATTVLNDLKVRWMYPMIHSIDL